MVFYTIYSTKNLRKPCRKKMVFEDYFEKFKGIKSLTACFGYSTILETIFQVKFIIFFSRNYNQYNNEY